MESVLIIASGSPLLWTGLCISLVYEGMMKMGRRMLLPWTPNIFALWKGRMSVFLAGGGKGTICQSCYGDRRMLLACRCESRCHGEKERVQKDNINWRVDCWINEQYLSMCEHAHQRLLRPWPLGCIQVCTIFCGYGECKWGFYWVRQICGYFWPIH